MVLGIKIALILNELPTLWLNYDSTQPLSDFVISVASGWIFPSIILFIFVMIITALTDAMCRKNNISPYTIKSGTGREMLPAIAFSVVVVLLLSASDFVLNVLKVARFSYPSMNFSGLDSYFPFVSWIGVILQRGIIIGAIAAILSVFIMRMMSKKRVLALITIGISFSMSAYSTPTISGTIIMGTVITLIITITVFLLYFFRGLSAMAFTVAMIWLTGLQFYMQTVIASSNFIYKSGILLALAFPILWSVLRTFIPARKSIQSD